MDKTYFNPDIAGYVLMALRHGLGDIVVNKGSYFANWYFEDKLIGGHCCSPYPGPEYGSTAWVRSDLVDIVESVVLPIRHTRALTGTEAHIINQRLRGLKQGVENEHVCLIKEVEDLYTILKEKGFTEVRSGSCEIFWNTFEKITLRTKTEGHAGLNPA